MNSGSIDNPRTKEGQLYALFIANIGREFTTLELGLHINSVCAHTYIDGCRDQVEARGAHRIRYARKGLDEVGNRSNPNARSGVDEGITMTLNNDNAVQIDEVEPAPLERWGF